MEKHLTDKKTVIIGASPNASRYAYLAAKMLGEYQVPFVPLGIKKGEVFGKAIQDLRKKPEIGPVHTITLYINPDHQKEWQDYLLGLKPKRIIFNPGTENTALMEKAKANQIEVVSGCTLVMLRSGQY